MNINDLVSQIINKMFEQVLNTFSSILSNDLMLVISAVLALSLILTGFFMIRDFLDVGLSDHEKAAKSAYKGWQSSKGTWREELEHRNYIDKLNDIGSQDYSDMVSSTEGYSEYQKISSLSDTDTDIDEGFDYSKDEYEDFI